MLVLINWQYNYNSMNRNETRNENNRGKIEIMADVVDLCKSGIKKTHIMYKGNLSYEQINRYLQELLKKSFIRQDVDEGVIVYRTTEKGRLFIHYYTLMTDTLLDDTRNDVKPNEPMPLIVDR
jgi:predicted transcriptional regulator